MTPRVAIACSGLGWVRRGNESWAATVAEALHKSGGHVLLFGGGPVASSPSPYARVPCLSRAGLLGRWLSWDKAYLLEQLTFARNLRRHLRSDRFDIVHCADPNTAQQLLRPTRKSGLELIYQDGLFIGPEWCRKFQHVQVFAPFYLDHAAAAAVSADRWRAIPQMVNTQVFHPAPDRPALRHRHFGPQLPPGAKVLLAVGDFSPLGKKRLEWIIEECARATSRPHLALAGQADASQLAAIQTLAQRLLPDRYFIFQNRPHSEMPALFQASDLFAHAALREPFGTVFIEAMACGLPALGHHFDVTKWIIGDGGETLDMTKPGELAHALDRWLLDDPARQHAARQAKQRTQALFSTEAVTPLYHDWYAALLNERLKKKRA